jgi:hypothetical protein
LLGTITNSFILTLPCTNLADLVVANALIVAGAIRNTTGLIYITDLTVIPISITEK